MSNIQKKFAAAIASGAMLLQLASPVLASSTTIVISGNGSDTDNDAKINTTQTTTVQQQNIANIENDVDVDANTGHNDANRNTGGDVEIDTGDTDVEVSVENTANSNVAKVNDCCPTNTDILISGNGDNSDNTVDLDSTSVTTLQQWNIANVENDVDVDADTGHNDAERNTGGDVSIKTGNANVKGVSVSNTLNANSAWLGSSGGGSGSLSLRILDNGSDSDNDIDLDLVSVKTLQQGNIADVENDVDVDANTGHNDANRNTGGEVEIDTGNADVEVMVDTLANFNWANVDDCLCLLDLLVKIAGNGDNSDNDIHADLASVLAADQFNEFFCGKGNHDGWGKRDDACNDVDVDVDTGKNDAERNTQGDKGADPSIMTGNADAFVEVETTANSNILNTGDGPFPSLPELPEIEAGFGVNLLGFWMWFAGMFS